MLETVTKLLMVVVAVPLVEILGATPLRLSVVAAPAEAANIKFCPEDGATVRAPPAVEIVADELEGDWIVRV